MVVKVAIPANLKRPCRPSAVLNIGDDGILIKYKTHGRYKELIHCLDVKRLRCLCRYIFHISWRFIVRVSRPQHFPFKNVRVDKCPANRHVHRPAVSFQGADVSN